MIAPRPLILSVDTSTPCCAVALTRGAVHDGELLASLVLNSKRTHSRRLLTGIDWLLEQSEISANEIEGLAVGLGPGSFTGLRIAMATMKGLATAMEVPLLGVSSLDALALPCTSAKALCVLLDARKEEVYRCWYSQDERGIYRAQGPIQALSHEDLAAEVKEPVLMVGDGLFKYGAPLRERLGALLEMAPGPLQYPTAVSLGLLGAECLQRGELLDPDSAVPLYIRASDAELNLASNKKCSGRAGRNR